MMNDDNNMYVNNYQLKHLQCVVIVCRVFMSHETQITEARTPQRRLRSLSVTETRFTDHRRATTLCSPRHLHADVGLWYYVILLYHLSQRPIFANEPAILTTIWCTIPESKARNYWSNPVSNLSEATSDNVWFREHKFGLLDGAKKQSVLQGW